MMNLCSSCQSGRDDAPRNVDMGEVRFPLIPDVSSEVSDGLPELISSCDSTLSGTVMEDIRTDSRYLRLTDKDCERFLEIEDELNRRHRNATLVRKFLSKHNYKSINQAKGYSRCCFRTREYPLHIAVKENNATMVKELLLAGADPERKNHKNQTPLQIAEKISPASAAVINNTNIMPV